MGYYASKLASDGWTMVSVTSAASNRSAMDFKELNRKQTQTNSGSPTQHAPWPRAVHVCAWRLHARGLRRYSLDRTCHLLCLAAVVAEGRLAVAAALCSTQSVLRGFASAPTLHCRGVLGSPRSATVGTSTTVRSTPLQAVSEQGGCVRQCKHVRWDDRAHPSEWEYNRVPVTA